MTKADSIPLRIAITFDWQPDRGFYLKTDLIERFQSLDVELVPLLDCNSNQIKRVLDEVDGLVLPGGVDDVDPARYKPDRWHPMTKVNTRRTDFEFRVLEIAMSPGRELPLLGICWGMQMMNVFLGGTLAQHLPDLSHVKVCHVQSEPCHEPTHWIEFTPGSKTAAIVGVPKIFANSTHHQAVEKPGERLEIDGMSEDGVIESGWIRDYPYGHTVQWHPERLKDDRVVPAFLNFCRERRDKNKI